MIIFAFWWNVCKYTYSAGPRESDDVYALLYDRNRADFDWESGNSGCQSVPKSTQL